MSELKNGGNNDIKDARNKTIRSFLDGKGEDFTNKVNKSNSAKNIKIKNKKIYKKNENDYDDYDFFVKKKRNFSFQWLGAFFLFLGTCFLATAITLIALEVNFGGFFFIGTGVSLIAFVVVVCCFDNKNYADNKKRLHDIDSGKNNTEEYKINSIGKGKEVQKNYNNENEIDNNDVTDSGSFINNNKEEKYSNLEKDNKDINDEEDIEINKDTNKTINDDNHDDIENNEEHFDVKSKKNIKTNNNDIININDRNKNFIKNGQDDCGNSSEEKSVFAKQPDSALDEKNNAIIDTNNSALNK